MEILSNPEAFFEKTAQHRLVFVQFGAKSCLPCTAIREKIDAWLDGREDCGAVYVPTEQHRSLCGQLGVFSVPTVQVYVCGRLTIRESGYFSLEQIFSRAEQYLELLEKEA